MKKIMILSGAGLSKESGLDTFRDAGGLWEGHDIMEVCSTQGWIKDRKRVIEFYNKRRIELESTQPNYAHVVLAKLEKKYRGRIIHLTQNIDDLMQRAGAKDVIHLHGKLQELRCEMCTQTFQIGYRAQNENDICPHCGNKRVRHNVVMFGENAQNYSYITQATKMSNLLIVIGTSGKVIDITKIAKEFKNSILIDPQRQETKSQYDPYKYIDEYFEHFIQKNATEAMDEMVEIIDEYMK